MEDIEMGSAPPENPGRPASAAAVFTEGEKAGAGPEKSSLLLNAIPHPVLLIRSDRTVVVANKSAAEMGAKVGQPCWREFCRSLFVHRGEKKCWFCLGDEALKENQEKRREVEAFGRVWDTWWVPVGQDSFLHYAFDVSRRKHVEIELARINELKSDLLSNVSHELKSPLTSIKGVVSTLLQKDVVLDEPTREALLTGISEETDRLTRLVSNLLNMSKLEAGVWQPEKEPCQISNIIRDVKKHQKWVHKRRLLLTQLSPDLPEVKMDPVQIKQVLINLIENALDFSEETMPISIGAAAANGNIEVSVSDLGVGIPSEELEQIFEKFFCGSRRRRRPGSTGLGLAICRSIITAHGGRIWAESEIGRGSTFRFTLPIPRPQDAGQG